MSTVKYFHSAMTDAPVLNGVAGSLIGVLDACLVNGFHNKSVDSIVVASNIATVSISTGHGYEVDAIVQIAGATPAGLNGDKRVLSATTNTLTFATTGIADQTATGTITAKLAPAGWEKPFSGTNLAVYRSPNVAGTRMFLRVDDTGTLDGRVVGYENMTDVNTGTGPFPTSTQQSGGLFWPKASTTATTARAWTIIADDRTFWYWANTHVTTASLGVSGATFGFGDFNSLKSGDAYSCAILGNSVTTGAATVDSNSTASHVATTTFTTAQNSYAPRSWTAIGGSARVDRVGTSLCVAANYSGSGATGHAAYPNAPDNSLILSTISLRENPLNFRGILRGATFSPQVFGTDTFNWRDKIDGQGVYAGRKLMALKGSGGAASATATPHTQFFDITGPW